MDVNWAGKFARVIYWGINQSHSYASWHLVCNCELTIRSTQLIRSNPAARWLLSWRPARRRGCAWGQRFRGVRCKPPIRAWLEGIRSDRTRSRSELRPTPNWASAVCPRSLWRVIVQINVWENMFETYTFWRMILLTDTIEACGEG